MSFEELIFDARSVVTVLSFLSFVGIALWAYSGRRRADFDLAARLPFADEMNTQQTDRDHG